MADKYFRDISIPVDGNARPAAVVFGYDPATDNFYPLTVVDNGDGTYKLQVDAVFGGSISIGNVSLKDATGPQLAKVSSDGKVFATADDNPLNKANITSMFTYRTLAPGLGKISTIKEYLSGAAPGDPAKLTTYTYNVDDKVSTVIVTDTTV